MSEINTTEQVAQALFHFETQGGYWELADQEAYRVRAGVAIAADRAAIERSRTSSCTCTRLIEPGSSAAQYIPTASACPLHQTPDPSKAVEHRQGDVAMVEGKVAVYFPTRWEWMDGHWTAIPLEVGPVLFNIYDKAAEAMSAIQP